MDRVKEINKIKLGIGYVLIKIHMKTSLIIAPDSKQKDNVQVDYAEVVAVAEDIKGINVGDVVLDFRTTEGFLWHEEQYAIIPRMNLKIVVELNNFNKDGLHRGKTKHLAN